MDPLDESKEVVNTSSESSSRVQPSKDFSSVSVDSSNEKKVSNESMKSECSEAEPKQTNWRKLALAFLTDVNVKQLLPELVRRVMTALRENENQPEELSLILVVHKVLKDDMFTPIVVHEFYQSKLKQAMPCLLGKISRYTH
ncbi:hypothetical protein RFI_11768, partial [Reticulomyxa filosa]